LNTEPVSNSRDFPNIHPSTSIPFPKTTFRNEK
jgi:hypothetical protein